MLMSAIVAMVTIFNQGGDRIHIYDDVVDQAYDRIVTQNKLTTYKELELHVFTDFYAYEAFEGDKVMVGKQPKKSIAAYVTQYYFRNAVNFRGLNVGWLDAGLQLVEHTRWGDYDHLHKAACAKPIDTRRALDGGSAVRSWALVQYMTDNQPDLLRRLVMRVYGGKQPSEAFITLSVDKEWWQTLCKR